MSNLYYSCCGTLCSTSETFVAINDKQQVMLYHLGLGFRWLLPKLEGVVSVSSIHRDTGFVIGGSGKAHLIDIPLVLITQVLHQGLSTRPCLLFLCIQFLLDSWSTMEEVVATSVCFLLNYDCCNSRYDFLGISKWDWEWIHDCGCKRSHMHVMENRDCLLAEFVWSRGSCRGNLTTLWNLLFSTCILLRNVRVQNILNISLFRLGVYCSAAWCLCVFAFSYSSAQSTGVEQSSSQATRPWPSFLRPPQY